MDIFFVIFTRQANTSTPMVRHRATAARRDNSQVRPIKHRVPCVNAVATNPLLDNLRASVVRTVSGATSEPLKKNLNILLSEVKNNFFCKGSTPTLLPRYRATAAPRDNSLFLQVRAHALHALQVTIVLLDRLLAINVTPVRTVAS